MLQMFVLALSLYNTWNRGVFLLCKITNLLIYSFLYKRWKGLEQGGGAQRRKQSHSAALLSPRVPTRRNVYRGSCGSKDFMAFLFCKPWVHGFCTVFARSVLSMSDYVGRCIALQSVPFFASGEQCQAELCLHFRVGILEQLQKSRHGDGGFACCGIYAENMLKRGHPDRWPLFCCRELSGCGSG